MWTIGSYRIFHACFMSRISKLSLQQSTAKINTSLPIAAVETRDTQVVCFGQTSSIGHPQCSRATSTVRQVRGPRDIHSAFGSVNTNLDLAH